MQAQERGQLNGAKAFHVPRTATENIAVANIAGQRIDRPILLISRDNVSVLQQDQGGLIATFYTGPDITAARSAFGSLVGDAFCIKNSGEIFHRAGFVARGIHSICSNQLLQPNYGFIFQRLANLRRGSRYQCQAE